MSDSKQHIGRQEAIRQIRAAFGADVGLPIPGDDEALELFDGLVEQYDAATSELSNLRRQMEELREEGHWPVSRLLEQLNAREPDYAVFHEWCVENMPTAVELCPYKFPKSGLLEQLEACQRLLGEHHAVGVLDGILLGDRCPVCAASDPASERPAPGLGRVPEIGASTPARETSGSADTPEERAAEARWEFVQENEWTPSNAHLDFSPAKKPGKPRPDYDPKLDWPERYTDGRPV